MKASKALKGLKTLETSAPASKTLKALVERLASFIRETSSSLPDDA